MAKNIVIAGAGLVGSMLACFLSNRGHHVKVFERRADMRRAGYIGGRSINLALSHRGWKGLKKLGLAEQVEKIAIPMTGRMIHDVDGDTHLIPYGTNGEAIYSVSRGDLNLLLVNEADRHEHVKFYFNQRCAGIDFEKNTVKLENTIEEKTSVMSADIIFGADGAYSEVRYEMQKTPNFNLLQQHEPYGYKELHIPAGENGSYLIEKNALHIWPRGSFMMIALPNMDGSFTVTLFAPFKGENAFDNIKTDADVKAFFTKYFPDAMALMPDLTETYFTNPTSSLVTIKCFPWKFNNTCLLGDAAHAIVPFFGQGMNCGFEDVFELDQLLEGVGDNWDAALDKFQYQRKPNGDAIADLALYNYIEMRDLSGREDFQLRLKIEKKIATTFPDKFMTSYMMITFSDLSYAEAKARGTKQAELLDTIMATPGIEQNWDSPEILQLAEKWITENA